MLREVRARKAGLDRGTVWNPRDGLKPLPGWVMEQMEQAKTEPSRHDMDEKEAWWDARPDKAPSDASTLPLILTSVDVDVSGFMWWACQASLDVPDHVKRFIANTSISQVLQRCGFHVDSIQEGRNIQGSDAKQEECLNRFLDLYEAQLAACEPDTSTAWQRSLSAVKLVPLASLLNCEESIDPEAVSKELWKVTAERLGLSGECALQRVWQRFMESLGKVCSTELEQAVKAALGEEMPSVLQVPREAEASSVQGQSVILKHRGRYFRVLSTHEPGDSQPDSRLNTAALLIQMSWRRSSRRRVQSHTARARECEEDSDILPEACQGQEAIPGDEADEARAKVEGASGTSPVLQPALVNESYRSPTIEGIDALPSQHVGSGPPTHPSEEHHSGRHDPESTRAEGTADQAPGLRAQVFDMTSGSTKLDIQTDDDARSCTPSLPSMVSEWQVIDDRQRLERFLLPAEDVGAFGFRVLPDWSDPDGKCSTSFDKTVQQWLSERLKDKLLKDCQRIAISIKDKHGKVAPSKLTDGELFVLVAYALDVRKKDSGLSWDMNFASRLSRVVRRQPDSIDKEMSTCLRYFNDALEKEMWRGARNAVLSTHDALVSSRDGPRAFAAVIPSTTWADTQNVEVLVPAVAYLLSSIGINFSPLDARPLSCLTS
ncbi:unnamed protein product [Symbiodinium sp. CCMP2592]|nr:unnamed protein product [Symbiodinium sp. CCMP2592]